MKIRSLFIFIFVFATVVICFNSCQKDSTDENPTKDVRDQYIGIWHVFETSNERGEYNYQDSIVKDPSNSSQVLIYNFHLITFNDYVYAIATSTSLTIPLQQPKSSNVKFEGTVKFENKNKLTWKYTLNDGADINEFTGTSDRIK